LAAAGVGTLGIVDGDIVDASNLQRQVLHKHGTVGQLKTNSAKEALLALNPDIDVRTYCRRLDRAGALELFKDYDIIVDGCDNFSTRYLINDVSVHHGKPVVHGSVYRFEGQVSVFKSAEGPCYRCLYPEAPPPELAPSCADAGVLGVLPGVIGLLQATEVIKLILVLGSGLIGRALRYDALAGRFRELRFAKNPTCPCCGPAAGPVSLTDEVQLACSVG
jgi:molybdopterin/thiamine biosynthesis adenylyltransferase